MAGELGVLCPFCSTLFCFVKEQTLTAQWAFVQTAEVNPSANRIAPYSLQLGWDVVGMGEDGCWE